MSNVAALIPRHPPTCKGVHSPEWKNDKSQCRLCWLATYDERYRVKWGLSDGGRAAASSLFCEHRGEVVGHVRPDKAGCGCKHGPSVYQCRATGDYAVILEPEWSGTTLNPVRMPSQVVQWKANGYQQWANIHACVGCQYRTEPATAEPYRLNRIAVGVTTAPREIPRLHGTLRGLFDAGVSRGDVVVFAEPESIVPEEVWVERADTVLGVTANWRRALERLLLLFPDADGIAIFQDDVQVSADALEVVRKLDIPNNAAFVSLYVPGPYAARAGVKLFSPEQVTFKGLQGGAMLSACSIIMPRPVAELLASDKMFRQDDRRQHLDAVIGNWAWRVNRKPYYLPESKAWHTGDTSTIHVGLDATGTRQAGELQYVSAVRSRDDELRIGVIGFNTASGLGTVARSAAVNLPNASFLALHHPEFQALPPLTEVPFETCRREDASRIASFVARQDIVLIFETNRSEHLVPAAKQVGVPTACLVMYENCPPQGLGSLAGIDVLICPNEFCYEQVSQDIPKHRLLLQPWPVDISKIRFRQRRTADTFLFCQGTGGDNDRKGSRIVAEAAKLLPDVQFFVRTQLGDARMRRRQTIRWPKNVEVFGMADDQSAIYAIGDVCIQPSRYEGMGLQLIESQSAGMPLITTNARPMSDYLPWKVVGGKPRQYALQRTITGCDVSPEELADTIRSVVGSDITAASRAACENMRRLYSWESLKKDVVAILKQAANVLG